MSLCDKGSAGRPTNTGFGTHCSSLIKALNKIRYSVIINQLVYSKITLEYLYLIKEKQIRNYIFNDKFSDDNELFLQGILLQQSFKLFTFPHQYKYTPITDTTIEEMSCLLYTSRCV